MIHKRILTLLLIIILFNQQFDLNAQVSKQNYEILRLIRHEKFDLILPDAMRDNNVDMWIHVTKDRPARFGSRRKYRFYGNRYTRLLYFY